jgi:hypothetical protein
MKIIDVITESYKLSIAEIKDWLADHIQSAVDDDDPSRYVDENFSVNKSTGHVQSRRLSLHPVIIDVEDEKIPITFEGFKYLTVKNSNIITLKNLTTSKLKSLEIENCHIETLEGCPDTEYLDIDACDKFKSTKGCSQAVKVLRLRELKIRVEDLVDIPQHLESLAFTRLFEMTTLKDIHKHVHAAGAIDIMYGEVESNIIGLMKIKGLIDIDVRYSSTPNAKKAFDIVKKNLSVSGGFAEAMDELIEAGLKEYAKL